ncbi:MAG: pantetheine-phosphate adenylyltransferase [Candidatus Lokiarchaeota archaeon]|nr:pantetheine-phosphate adenylyltransferase [Candidatus Lokiarchaeota archaeon]
MAIFDRVGVAGTFSQFHKGHKRLLSLAFQLGDTVIVALTADKMTKNKEYADKIPTYKIRKRNLITYLKRNNLYEKTEIIKLENKYGTAIIDPVQDAIVVSEETYPVAKEINNIRKEKNLNPLVIVSIPLVRAKDNSPISSTRIRAGIVDSEGNLLD